MNYKLVKCDRCEIILQIPVTRTLHKVKIDDEDHDYCEDCFSSLCMFHESVKEFDSLANELARELAGE